MTTTIIILLSMIEEYSLHLLYSQHYFGSDVFKVMTIKTNHYVIVLLHSITSMIIITLTTVVAPHFHQLTLPSSCVALTFLPDSIDFLSF